MDKYEARRRALTAASLALVWALDRQPARSLLGDDYWLLTVAQHDKIDRALTALQNEWRQEGERLASKSKSRGGSK